MSYPDYVHELIAWPKQTDQITLKELAESLNATIFELMKFAPDDISRDITDQTEIPTEVENVIRKAWTMGQVE